MTVSLEREDIFFREQAEGRWRTASRPRKPRESSDLTRRRSRPYLPQQSVPNRRTIHVRWIVGLWLLLWLACNVLALEDAVERLQVSARGEQFGGVVGWLQGLLIHNCFVEMNQRGHGIGEAGFLTDAIPHACGPWQIPSRSCGTDPRDGSWGCRTYCRAHPARCRGRGRHRARWPRSCRPPLGRRALQCCARANLLMPPSGLV